MPEQEIVCPNCGEKIALTEALMHPIEEKIRKEYEEKEKKLEGSIKERQKELDKKAEELEDAEKIIEERLQKELTKAKDEIERKAKEKAEEELSVELKDLEQKLKEKSEKLVEAEKMELELRKKQRELEEREGKFELEMARKLDEERKKIAESLSVKMREEYQFKEAEYKKKISDMSEQIDDLRRKADQTSSQLSGEVLELKLEELLKMSFPADDIEPVPKGSKGADILQKVYTSSGRLCGVIIWECKRAKNWSDKWIQKLKDDQRRIKADIAVLATTALPKDVTDFTYVDGVLITNYQLAVPISTLLRTQLIEVTRIKQSTIGRDEKIEILYKYLTSPDFRQKIETIAEAFLNMKNDLDQEKRAMTRIWAKREEQIRHAVYGIAGMYGEMQGILGASLPEIKSLKLPEFSSGTDTNETEENRG